MGPKRKVTTTILLNGHNNKIIIMAFCSTQIIHHHSALVREVSSCIDGSEYRYTQLVNTKNRRYWSAQSQMRCLSNSCLLASVISLSQTKISTWRRGGEHEVLLLRIHWQLIPMEREKLSFLQWWDPGIVTTLRDYPTPRSSCM